jgi:hypothetical protein
MPPDDAGMAGLLRLLPELESPDFVPATWPERWSSDEEGNRILHMPFPEYHPTVLRFLELARSYSAGIEPYKALPEDGTDEDIPFSVLGVSFPLAYIESATENQIRRYFVLLMRGERFCDGHIAGELQAGKPQAALRRLAALHESEP